MDQFNTELITYSREGGESVLHVRASPILQQAEEIQGGIEPGVIRAEYQEWGINLDQVLTEAADQTFYEVFGLPRDNDRITREGNADEYIVLTPIGVREKAYRFTTSTRDRVLVCSIRQKDGADE